MLVGTSTPTLEQGEIFRLMIDKSPVPISIQAADWRFVYVNDAYCRYVGYERPELLGRDPADFLFTPETRGASTVRDPFASSLPWGRTDNAPIRELVRKDATRVRFRLLAGETRSAEGEPLWCGILFDLDTIGQLRADLAAANERARSMQVRFDAFAGMSSDAIVVIDLAQGCILQANESVREVLGISAQAVVGQPIERLWEHVSEVDRPGLQEIWDAYSPPPDSEIVVSLNLPFGGMRSVRVRILRSQRAPTQGFVLAEDVTDFARHEARLLQQAVLRRDRLIREIHHRIRNSLQGVVGILEAALRREDAPLEAIASALRQVGAVATTHGLLDQAAQGVTVGDLLQGLVRTLREQRSARIRLDLGSPEVACAMLSVEDQAVPFALAVNELLDNAVRHGRGEVNVALRNDEYRFAVHVRNRGSLPTFGTPQDIRPTTRGLGLVKALLREPRAGFRIVGVDGWVEAVVYLAGD